MATKSIKMNIKKSDDKIIDKICNLFEKKDSKNDEEKENKFNVIKNLKDFNV